MLCGWTILQSYGTYRITHVLNHHPKIGNDSIDPDLVYMLEQGVYKSQSRSDFLKNYFIKPLLGSNIPHYIRYLIKDRFITAFRNDKERTEAIMIVETFARNSPFARGIPPNRKKNKEWQ